MATNPTLRLLAVLALLAAAPAIAQPAKPKVRPAPAPPADAAALPPVRPAMIYRLDLIRSGPLPPDAVQKFQPMHTMGEIESYLKANDISFMWRRQDMDSTTAPPEFVRLLESLPANEVFVTPQSDGGAVIGSVLSRRRARPTP